MLVLLPRQADGLAAVEKSLSAARIGQLRAKLQSQRVDAFLPKFKLETCYELNDALKAMGMKQAFVAGKADFSGIDGGTGYFFISQVIHKAFVDVNERGTEAAAATAVVMQSAAAPANPPVVFRADHPFLFLICDNLSGSILFLGQNDEPEGRITPVSSPQKSAPRTQSGGFCNLSLSCRLSRRSSTAGRGRNRPRPWPPRRDPAGPRRG